MAAALIALVAAGTADGNHGPPPWTGGAGATSPLEARINAISTELAGNTAFGHCPTPDEWVTLTTTRGMDPGSVYAFVPGTAAGPSNYAYYNPTVCYLLDEFLAKPTRDGQKVCQVGTRTETRTETRTQYRTETQTRYRTETRTVRFRATVRKRVKVAGRWRWKRVKVWRTKRVSRQVPYQVQVQVPYTVTVQVPVAVPVYGTCRDYELTVESIETVAHESTHTGGLRSEPAAECYGLQLTALTAQRLGAVPSFAIEIGRDYLPLYADFVGSSPDYFTPDCYDGGALDLWPTVSGWPTPVTSARASGPGYVGRAPRIPFALDSAEAQPAYVARGATLPHVGA